MNKGSSKVIVAGSLNKYHFHQADVVYSIEGLAPTIQAHNANTNGHQIQIEVEV